MAKAVELRDMSDEQLGLTLKEANENLFRLRYHKKFSVTIRRRTVPDESSRNSARRAMSLLLANSLT